MTNGSLKGFIQGKHYNRCKRLHPLLASAFEMLHFESFLKSHDVDEPTLTVISNDIRRIRNSKTLVLETVSLEINKFIEGYEQFSMKTLVY